MFSRQFYRQRSITFLLRKFNLKERSIRSVKSLVGFTNYELGKKEFEKLEVPEYFNFAEHVLEDWKRKETLSSRTLPAFWWVDEQGKEIKWNFTQLLQEADRLANVLKDVCKVERGDRVMVILPRVPQWWLANIACLKLGAISIPGTTTLTVKDIRNRLLASKTHALITTQDLCEAVDQACHDTSLKEKLYVSEDAVFDRTGWKCLNSLCAQAPDSFETLKTRGSDPLSWFFTSGTTGLPKMAEHSHVSYGFAHQSTGKHWLDLTPDDVMWNISDTGWAKSAYSSFFGPWWQGSCVFVHHTPRFDVSQTLKILHDYPVSVMCLPPTAYRLAVQHDDFQRNKPFKALRHCVSAGEPLNPEVIGRWKEVTGITINEAYGQTEMTVSCGNFFCLPNKPGSMGKPTPGYQIDILDGEGQIAPNNEEGEVAIKCKPNRPTGLFTKYVNDPEKTASVFKGDYYLTGDRAYKDEDDYLWFVGRSDDLINSSGYRIGPFEVESALLEHPAVAESAVIGVPCTLRGMIVKAFVILTKDHKRENMEHLVKELQNHVKIVTAPYKYPRMIEFVEQLPKTISGKIRRVELRAMEKDGVEK